MTAQPEQGTVRTHQQLVHEHDHAGEADGGVHGHSHAHGHPHVPVPGAVDTSAAQSAELAQLGPTTPGSVVLDIGGDIGSLMIMTNEDLAGAEIEVSPVGQDDARTHIAIRERLSPGGTRWAGIFPGLKAGEYTVWDVRGMPSDVVAIVGGHVTQLDWR